MKCSACMNFWGDLYNRGLGTSIAAFLIFGVVWALGKACKQPVPTVDTAGLDSRCCRCGSRDPAPGSGVPWLPCPRRARWSGSWRAGPRSSQMVPDAARGHAESTRGERTVVRHAVLKTHWNTGNTRITEYTKFYPEPEFRQSQAYVRF